MHTNPRLYVQNDLSSEDIFSLSKEQSHYLKNVMRMQEGDKIRVFDGKNGEFEADITKIDKKSVQIQKNTQIREQIVQKNRVSLLFCPLKKAKLDFLVEKACELGATDLYPVLSARTQVRNINAGRLNAQIIEAAEQCERLNLPRLHDLQKLENALAGWQGADIITGAERGEWPDIAEHNISGDSTFLIGPEGGWSDSEIELFQTYKHISPVSLGADIMRAETAALFCLSFVKIRSN